MATLINRIKKGLDDSYSYAAYENLIEDLLKAGKSTTKGGDEQLVEYSKLGLQRMKRWDKKLNLTAEVKEKVKAYSKKRIWLVLAEGWCGDAAHSVPVIHKVAALNEHIDLRIVLREAHPDLMNDFLTNGGKSIPKLVSYDPENESVEATWGPRPAGAAEIFAAYKAAGFEVMEPKLQAWYNKDKGQSTAQELMALLK